MIALKVEISLKALLAEIGPKSPYSIFCHSSTDSLANTYIFHILNKSDIFDIMGMIFFFDKFEIFNILDTDT